MQERNTAKTFTTSIDLLDLLNLSKTAQGQSGFRKPLKLQQTFERIEQFAKMSESAVAGSCDGPNISLTDSMKLGMTLMAAVVVRSTWVQATRV